MSEVADKASIEASGRASYSATLRPRMVAIAAVAGLALLGWLYLSVMVAGIAQQGRAAAFGPGMGLFDLLIGLSGGEGFGRFVEAICRPRFGLPPALGLVVEYGLVALMWCMMAFAMMMPTAGPMVVTYAEIAETAAAKCERVASPLWLVAGYATVWIGFCLAAAGLQIGLTRAAVIDPSMATVSPLFSGAVFLGAGVYQFSALKLACMTRCQSPFPFFFANWSQEPRVVYRLGVRQGLYCLGCCWAAMMVMLAVGVMNVVWMAILGLLMTGEKVASTARLSRIAGIVFLAIGATVIAWAVAAAWPGRPG